MSNTENEVVLIKNDVVAYGKLTKKAIKKLGREGINTLHKQLSMQSFSSYDEARRKANSILKKKKVEMIIWPLSSWDLKRIQLGILPGGLLLSRIDLSELP